KTCPTHRGLRPIQPILPCVQNLSEDLPHLSVFQAFQTTSSQGRLKMSENLPHSSGIKIKQP
ncbi:hypothetical protein, partial [Neisseria sp. HMSC064E01]|uniref:hypothetical protein n=1 Tax=Neisseria sp. HMSC064E01 TaxID=1715052 RepID=UPI001AEFCBD8